MGNPDFYHHFLGIILQERMQLNSAEAHQPNSKCSKLHVIAWRQVLVLILM